MKMRSLEIVGKESQEEFKLKNQILIVLESVMWHAGTLKKFSRDDVISAWESEYQKYGLKFKQKNETIPSRIFIHILRETLFSLLPHISSD